MEKGVTFVITDFDGFITDLRTVITDSDDFVTDLRTVITDDDDFITDWLHFMLPMTAEMKKPEKGLPSSGIQIHFTSDLLYRLPRLIFRTPFGQHRYRYAPPAHIQNRTLVQDPFHTAGLTSKLPFWNRPND